MDYSIKEEYRAKRLKNRIRIREISELLGCTNGLISNWENGRGYMSEEKIRQYKEYIDECNKEEEVETQCLHV
jgi:transcriptional regulator with XRE-family HTH domain